MFGGMFGGGKTDPSAAARPWLDKIPGAISPYYDPYINAGRGALGDMTNLYKSLLSDPTSIMKRIGATYQASPGYQYNVQQATNSANNAAAAGGMTGSPAEQAALAGRVSGLASQDYNNYMNQALGLFGQGMGLGQNINQMGYGASNSMAQALIDQLMSEANLSYAGAASKNAAGGGMGALAGMLGKFL